MVVVFALALSLVLAGVALGSGGAEARGWSKRGGPEARQARQEQRRLRFLKRRAKLLRQDVGLSEAKARKVEKTQDAFHKERRALGKAMHESHRTLLELVKADSADQKAYKRALQSVMSAHKAMNDIKQRELRAIARLLTPKQQAKLMVSFHRARRQMHRHARQGRRGGNCVGKDCARRGQRDQRGPRGPRGGPGGMGPGGMGPGDMGPGDMGPGDMGPGEMGGAFDADVDG